MTLETVMQAGGSRTEKQVKLLVDSSGQINPVSQAQGQSSADRSFRNQAGQKIQPEDRQTIPITREQTEKSLQLGEEGTNNRRFAREQKSRHSLNSARD